MATQMGKFIRIFFILKFAFSGVTDALQKEKLHGNYGMVNKRHLLNPLCPVKCSHKMLQSMIFDSRNLMLDTRVVKKSFDGINMYKSQFPNRFLSNEDCTLNGSDIHLICEDNFKTSGSSNSLNRVGLKKQQIAYKFSNKYCKTDYFPLKSESNPLHFYLSDKQANSSAGKPLAARIEPSRSLKRVDKSLQSSMVLRLYEAPLYNYLSRQDFMPPNALRLHETLKKTNSTLKFVFLPNSDGIKYGADLLLKPSVGYDNIFLSNNRETRTVTNIPHLTVSYRTVRSLTYSNTPITNIFELKSSMSSPASFLSFSDIASTASSMSEVSNNQISGYSHTSTESTNQEESTDFSPSLTSGRTYRSSVVPSLSESGYTESRFISSSVFNDSDTSGSYNLTNTTEEYS